MIPGDEIVDFVLFVPISPTQQITKLKNGSDFKFLTIFPPKNLPYILYSLNYLRNTALQMPKISDFQAKFLNKVASPTL